VLSRRRWGLESSDRILRAERRVCSLRALVTTFLGNPDSSVNFDSDLDRTLRLQLSQFSSVIPLLEASSVVGVVVRLSVFVDGEPLGGGIFRVFLFLIWI